jgi:hypothetical protein
LEIQQRQRDLAERNVTDEIREDGRKIDIFLKDHVFKLNVTTD